MMYKSVVVPTVLYGPEKKRLNVMYITYLQFIDQEEQVYLNTD